MKKKRAYHHPDLKRTLMEAADAELKEQGVAGLSLRRIAARAGASHAAPYRHFKDKDELVSALVWETQGAFTSALRAAREAGTTARNRLFRIGEAYLRFARENPVRLSLMFSETATQVMGRYHPPLTPENREKYDSFGELEKTVKECQAEGILDPSGDSGAISILVWSLVHGLATIEREGFVASLGGQRGLKPETTRAMVMDAFRSLVERNARPAG
jgi:AcrR family transcriptional regulator